MYSLLVVLPVNRMTAPFEELAALLVKELSSLDSGKLSDEESKLLLWISVMGAIMTVGTLGRAYFTRQLVPIARRLQLNSWDDMKAILSTFLWLEMTNDVDGIDVWDDISRYNTDDQDPSSSSSQPFSSSNVTIRTLSNAPALESEARDEDPSTLTPW
jgi:hypothetical protein